MECKRAKSTTCGMKVCSFRFYGSGFTNYFMLLDMHCLSVALSHMNSTDTMNIIVMVKSLKDMGQFETKTIDDFIVSCSERRDILAVSDL